MSQQSKQATMFRLVEQWQQTSKTQKQFCREQSLTYSTFMYWLKKYRQVKGQGSNFIPLEVTASQEPINSLIYCPKI